MLGVNGTLKIGKENCPKYWSVKKVRNRFNAKKHRQKLKNYKKSIVLFINRNFVLFVRFNRCLRVSMEVRCIKSTSTN